MTCILMTTGQVKCVGDGLNGKIGLGNSADYGNDPSERYFKNQTFITLPRPAIKIAANFQNACAILDDYSVRCWGLGTSAVNGQGNTTAYSSPPATAVNLGTNKLAIDLKVGWYGVCVLLSDSSIKCWGQNFNGFLGQNIAHNTIIGDSAAEMGDNLPAINFGVNGASETYTVKSFTIGNSDSVNGASGCAILHDGDVKCWGFNTDGELGIDNMVHVSSPTPAVANTPVTYLGQDATQIFSGSTHHCAILVDLSMKCWGSNDTGQLGIASTSDWGVNATTRSMTLLGPLNFGPGVGVLSGSAGSYGASADSHTCAILTSGELKCWGENDTAFLGHGGFSPYSNVAGETMLLLPETDLGW